MDNIIQIIKNQDFNKFIVVGFMIIFIGVMLFYVLDNNEALNSKTYIYTFTILIPIAICVWFFMQTNADISNDSSNIYIIGIIIGLIMLFSFVFYLYFNMSAAYYSIINYVLNVIIFLGIMIALSIIYNITMNNLNKLEGLPGILVGFIFYIPCMISDFINYLLQQYKLTPNVVFVLFVIEIILILLYIYIPKLITKIFIPKPILLQNTPVFLDQGTITLITADKLYPPSFDKTNLLLKNQFLKNYCISMWIFINPQNKSNMSYAQETEIFNYSYTDRNKQNWAKPRITYSYDTNSLNDESKTKDQYHIYVAPNISYNMTIVSQKWNQFVFNYKNNIVDIFVNGNLERSFSLTDNMPQYDITDAITIGAPNGLDGAICNITYSNTPLTSYQIANSYNLYMIKNPPINQS